MRVYIQSLQMACADPGSFAKGGPTLTVRPRKTRPYITERLLNGRKESNQTK